MKNPMGIQGGINAFRLGRAIVLVPVFLIGAGLWIYDSADNALNYTEVSASVDRAEEVCVPRGTSYTEATDCLSATARAAGKELNHYQAVSVTYVAPADHKSYSGRIFPEGGSSAVEATHLKLGDHWTILVHDKDPHNIKAR